MDRRTFLSTVGATGAAGATTGLAGCLSSIGLGDANPDVVLGEPDRPFDSEDVPYPAWGERVPAVELPAPVDGGTVAFRDADVPTLATFFYSHCNTICPVLISTLRNVQTHAANEGYPDDVAFYPVTFDPERDTAGRLDEYAEQMNVDADAANWTFLRPASTARAKAVVDEQFGVAFERTHPEDMDMYMFNHGSLTVLVNRDGYVERAYTSTSPDEERIIEDLREVREA